MSRLAFLRYVALGLALGPAAARAQSYVCGADTFGTNCNAVLADAASRYNSTTTPSRLQSQLTVLPGACDPSAKIVDVNVSLKLTHEWVGDLSASLTHPDGTTVAFLFRPGLAPSAPNGCPSDDLEATFSDEAMTATLPCSALIPAVSGELVPFNPLAIFDGKPRNGVWTLTLNDNSPGGFGALESWQLDMPCALPTVTIEASDAEAGPDPSDTGTFTVRREGTAGATTVHYTVGGTITPGDIQPLSGNVTIPDGADSATITVTPVDDGATGEPAKTVVLTLQPGDYALGSFTSATVTIRPDGTSVDGGTEGGSDEGCGCHVGGRGAGSSAGVLAFAALVLLARRRRARA